jgi:hypothetical protein
MERLAILAWAVELALHSVKGSIMADFGIKPDIALGIKGPQPQSLGDLLGTATKAMEFSRLSELYPELIKKSTAETASAQTSAEKAAMGLNLDRAQTITNGQVSLMFNPLVVAAAQGKPVDKNALLETVTENARVQAKNAGIDWETQGKQLAAPYITRAMNDPASLQGYIKQRMFAGLDQATRANMMTPEIVTSGLPAPAQITRAEGIARPLQIEGGQVPQVSEPPRGVTPEMMTAPIVPQAAPVAAPQAAPIVPQAAPVAAPQAAPMAAPVDPGFPVRFPVRRAGDIRPIAPGEQEAATAGNTYLNNMMVAQGEVPKAIRNVSEVIKGAEELEKTVNFQTGKPADIERAVRTFFGEDQYKQLSKDIANAQIALMRSTGGDLTTDAGKALVARATGDETYPPQVLLSIARRLNGELTKVDMEARGAQGAATLFGNANLPAFQQAWNSNADLRVFEAISIVNNIRDPKKQKSALDKILPTNSEELADFQQKYRNIKKLTETGTLR